VLCCAVECCMERGASSWLSALPLEQYGFTLYKGEFIDAVCLRCGFTLSLLPSHCVCGKDFTLSHTLSCTYGAFQLSDTMKYKIWQLVWWQKCVMVSKLSLTHMPSPVRLCIIAQLCLMIMPEWISEHPVFGGAYIITPFLFNSLATSNYSTILAADWKWGWKVLCLRGAYT